MGIYLRYGYTSHMYLRYDVHLRYDMHLMYGIHLRYGRVSQVWACISGMGVHLRYRHALCIWRESQV